MERSRKRLFGLVSTLPLLIVAAALIYMAGMSWLEGEPRGFWRSVEFAAETLSTTGYGSDTTWSHPVMTVFVVVLQFLGVFLVFLVFPIYLIPLLEERFEARLPKTLKIDDGGVLIYRYGPAVASLLEELDASKVPAAVLEEDEGEARRQLERGHRVLYGHLDDGLLADAGLSRARALVANGSDDENASLILAARQQEFKGDILALVEEPAHRKPMMLAGATAVYTPRHILGAALAARASRRISPTIEGAQLLGRRLVVSEVRIGHGSVLAGQSLKESRLGERTGVSVIGQWVGGRLVTPPTADMPLVADGILIVVGSEESVERFSDICRGTVPLKRTGGFVVAGFGEVGHKVVEVLRDVGEEIQVIDRREKEGVDLVGDILDHRVLESSEVRDAQAAVLAVDSDSATLFATVIIKDFAPHVPVIARVNRGANVERIHRAGADFALSISEVSGQILAGRLLGQEAIRVDPQLKVLKVSPRGLVGKNPAELEIRQRTGASVVAVERGDAIDLELGPDYHFEESDTVYICGSNEATRRYLQAFPQD